MSKTTFSERFQKTIKFYDLQFHHHKATFKGLSQFYKTYSSIERQYANELIKLSESIISEIPDFNQQQPYIQQGVKEVINNMERVSQMHFNYAERLKEMSQEYKEEYNKSKKYKERFMKTHKEKSLEDHEKVKESKNRNMLNQKEKEICKALYDGLEKYMQEETIRTNRMKEQIVIYFCLSKKIYEKQLELAGAYTLRMAQYEVEIKVPQIYEVEELLIDQYNGYGADKLERKNRDVTKQLIPNRQSLKDSLHRRDRMLKIQEHQSKIKQIIQRYQDQPENLMLPQDEQHHQLVGIFDRSYIRDYRQFSREVKNQIFKDIFYFMLINFYHDDGQEETKSILTFIKVQLKVKALNSEKCTNILHFMSIAQAKLTLEHQFHLAFLIALSNIYQDRGTIDILYLLFRKELPMAQLLKSDGNLNWRLKIVVIDCLLDSIIVVRDEKPILEPDFVDILKFIIKFGIKFLNVDESITVLLLLRKIQRAISILDCDTIEDIHQLLNQSFQITNCSPEYHTFKMEECHRLVNTITKRIIKFYTSNTPLANFIKILLVIERILPKNYFDTIQHVLQCIRSAGFNYLIFVDQNKRIIECNVWRGEEKLKNLVEALSEIDYEEVNDLYFKSAAAEISKLRGIGTQIVHGKLIGQFTTPMYEIVKGNLEILKQEGDVDRQGYALKLGMFLAEMDGKEPRKLEYYDEYFIVLGLYLSSTEKDYNLMLDRSRKTELWITQENSQATQNCIDFCSLLYKPFQFLLTSLKQLEESPSTPFTKRFSDFIKLRLNGALREQILKYIQFLYDSLNTYTSQCPQLNLKPKRHLEVIKTVSEEVAKEKYGLKEIVRRIQNLIFIKDQLDSMIHDFLDKEIYSQIENSIFNLSLLRKIASRDPSHRQILENIAKIVEDVCEYEKKIVSRIAGIAVFHFMQRIFNNLYFQEQRGAFTQFFSNKSDYKLSQFTFVKAEAQIEEMMVILGKNIPSEIVDEFSMKFTSNFFINFRFEVLNSCKFKLPFNQKETLNYLDKDISFASSLIKKRFIDSAIVLRELEKPAKNLFEDIEKISQKLMDQFQDATIKNDRDSSLYCLVLLNLRVNDEKAQQFVKKYKNITLLK